MCDGAETLALPSLYAGIVPGGASRTNLTCRFSSRRELLQIVDCEQIGGTDLQERGLVQVGCCFVEQDFRVGRAHRGVDEAEA